VINKSLYQFESVRMAFTEITWDDLGYIHQLHSMPEVDEFNTLGIPENIDITREVLRPAIDDQAHAERKLFFWSIRNKESAEFMGIAGLTLAPERFRMGEIFYKLSPSFWHKGYGTETAKSLINFGIDILKLHRIHAGVSTQNKRSIHVLEKSGMTREGLNRKILPVRGEWKDNYHYAILENDPRE